MRQGNYILWLPSWYPNKHQPFNGDFIQRHAVATSEYCTITLFYFNQDCGPEILELGQENQSLKNNLTEYIYYPMHKPLRIKFLNRLVYNIRFYTQAKTRLINHFNKYGLPAGVHVHVPVKAGNLALWIKKKWGIPFLVSEQSSHYISTSPDAFFNGSFLYRLQVKRIFKQAVIATNVSKNIGIQIQTMFGLKEVVTVHNLVQTDLFYYHPSPNAQFTFVHVSSLTEQKNISGMLNAFAQLATKNKNWILKLVGPKSGTLVRVVAQLGLQENVLFTGEVAYKEVAHHMQASNAFVLFSSHENFPCVIVEALCCGLPVIASDIAGNGEAVNLQNGISVQEGNIPELANALEKIILNYSQYNRWEISQRASKKYNAKAIGSQIFYLYKQYFSAVQ